MEKKIETWAEFHARVQPNDGDEFVDDRGQVWIYRFPGYWLGRNFDGFYLCNDGFIFWDTMTCPLTPIVKKKTVIQLFPFATRCGRSSKIYVTCASSIEDAKERVKLRGDEFIQWNPKRNEDGSWEVEVEG